MNTACAGGLNAWPDNAVQKPDCVVIDTNVWRSGLLLKTPVGVSLVYALARQRGFLGLPEVVERELTKHVVEAGREAIKTLEKSSRIIETLTGLSFSTLPAEIALENIVEARIAELEPILVRVPFTLEHAKAALDMVNAKLPPNSKSQEFKDSAIWQAVLTLSRKYTTHLITNDRAFLYKTDDPSQGLAANLKQDCVRVEGKVDVYCDLASCLKAIRSDAPVFNRERLISLIYDAIMPQLLQEARRNRFEIREILDTEITAFRTEHADRLAVDYTVSTRCDLDPSVEETMERTDFRAITKGSCYYDGVKNSISGHFIEDITFAWKYSTGGSGRTSRSLGEVDPSIPFRRPDLEDRPW